MACHCILNSSSFVPSLSFQPKFRRIRPSSSHVTLPITCKLDDDDEEESKSKNNLLDILKISVTLTVISASLPQPSMAAKVSQKKIAAKQVEFLTTEDLETWSKQLPVVTNRLPYTDILSLKREGKLKHIITHPAACLREESDLVFAVLEDTRVFRVVVPSDSTDFRFWMSWDELDIDSVCVNAYTPPLEEPQLPRPFLAVLFDKYILPSLVKEPGSVTVTEPVHVEPKPLQSKKVLELMRTREELQKRTYEVENKEIQKKLFEKAEKAARSRKFQAERKRTRAMRARKAQMSYVKPDIKRSKVGDRYWTKLANDNSLTNFLGFLFFFVFYQTVVYSYRKQKKDFDERLRMLRYDDEEKRKRTKFERDILGIIDQDIAAVGEEGEQADYDPMKQAVKFMKSGARVRLARDKRLPQYLEGVMDVTFSDVAGLGKIRLELEEIVKFFTHGEMYRRRGIKIPGGILLSGPPGVGKTLLAKAVAGEAGVNFFSISASQFVEIYVGVGASRVRALYQEAKENAPSIVFIDELDAVGRERGLVKGSGGQERDATLNQLLVCLDGFEGRGEVITIASTNRPEILDPALVRPGRFDRKIHIPKPGIIGRAEILKVHARKKPVAEDVDFMAVAGITNGMVGAELANLFEIAAITMMREKRTEITTDDLIQAAQIEDMGMLERKERNLEMWKRIALNEGSLAVAAVNFRDLKTIEFITIAQRFGNEVGYVRPKLEPIKFESGMVSRQTLLDYITVQLAPRAADAIWFGEDQEPKMCGFVFSVTLRSWHQEEHTGVGSYGITLALSTLSAPTTDNARSAARSFLRCGFSDKHYGLSNLWVADRIDDIDPEAVQILNMCYQRAKEVLKRNWKLMEAVVDELVEKKRLSKQEFSKLVELYGSIEPFPADIPDIRANARSQFQDSMMNRKEATIRGGGGVQV